MLAAGSSRRCETRLYDPLEFFCSRVELTSVPGGQNAMAHLKKRKLEAESAATKPKQQQQQQQQLGALSNAKKGHISGAQANDMETTSSSDTVAKRRRKSVRDDQKSTVAIDGNGNDKNIPLPQKKRVFSSNSGSPARKASKNNSEEPEDDETLIRETEAALKSLSGSWVPGPRGSFYQRGNSDEDRYESNFENLFEEKKDAGSKMSPSSMSQSSTTSNDTGCSLKDVITLRGQQDRSARFQQQQQQSKMMESYKLHNGGKVKKEDCEGNTLQCIDGQSQNDVTKRVPINRSAAYKDRLADGKYSRYEPPDFNELVDESSNELEIDMSDPAADRHDHDPADKNRMCKNESSTNSGKNLHQQSVYGGYQRSYADGLKVNSSSPSPVGSSFSVTSAFRPPNTDHSKSGCRSVPSSVVGAPSSIPPMGPYPAAATFVGYPSPGPTMPVPQPVPGMSPPVDEKHPSTVSLLQLKSPKEEAMPSVQRADPSANPLVSATKAGPSQSLAPIGSPDNSKQYTILQPAGLGSRAASAIQDIAREGVVSVAAVSSTNSPGANNCVSTGTGASKQGVSNGNSNGGSGANAGCVPVASNTGSVNNNSITITTMTTTATTTSPSAIGDVSTTSIANHQDNGIKMADRPGSFDGNRPGMSMSPSSLSRGKFQKKHLPSK